MVLSNSLESRRKGHELLIIVLDEVLSLDGGVRRQHRVDDDQLEGMSGLLGFTKRRGPGGRDPAIQGRQ